MRRCFIPLILLLSLHCFAEAAPQWSRPPSSEPAPGIRKKQKSFPGQKEEDLSFQNIIEWTQPGLVTLQDERWVGQPYLPKFPRELPVVLQLTQFESQQASFPEEEWRKAAIETLAKAGYSQPIYSDKILPFYDLQVILYPFAKGHVASITGRVLQGVDLHGVNLDRDQAYQAIVWEKTLLVYHTHENISQSIKEQIDQITTELTQVLNENRP